MKVESLVGAVVIDDGLLSTDGANPSTSFLVILPPSPLPLTCAKFIPLSAANFLARGDALILWSVVSGEL